MAAVQTPKHTKAAMVKLAADGEGRTPASRAGSRAGNRLGSRMPSRRGPGILGQASATTTSLSATDEKTRKFSRQTTMSKVPQPATPDDEGKDSLEVVRVLFKPYKVRARAEAGLCCGTCVCVCVLVCVCGICTAIQRHLRWKKASLT